MMGHIFVDLQFIFVLFTPYFYVSTCFVLYISFCTTVQVLRERVYLCLCVGSCVCVCVCVCVCMCVCVFVCVRERERERVVCVCVCVCVREREREREWCVCVCVCLSVCLYVSLSLHACFLTMIFFYCQQFDWSYLYNICLQPDIQMCKRLYGPYQITCVLLVHIICTYVIISFVR